MVSILVPVLLKYGAYIVFSTLPKEWLYSKRFCADFEVVFLFVKERWCTLNLVVKLLPVWPECALPQSGHESLCTPLVRYLSFSLLICFLGLRLCSLEFLVLKCIFISVCLNRSVINLVSFTIYVKSV